MGMMDEKITLDKKSFEALAADTRVKVLKSLAERRKTLSELAAQLGLSPSTVKEHMQVLGAAGLVDLKDEGRKWKYYELTRKGKSIVQPQELKIWVVLSLTIVAIAAAFFLFTTYLPGQAQHFGMGDGSNFAKPASAPSVPGAEAGTSGIVVEGAPRLGVGGGEGIVPSAPPAPAPMAPNVAADNGMFTPSVKGCAGSAEAATKDAGSSGTGTEKTAELSVAGNTLAYSRALNNACCLQAVLNERTEGNAITITEEWSGEPCDCTCFSEISAVLANLPAGNYAVSVYENGSLVGNGGEPRLVISKEVQVG
ncbi:Bacterial regulatory protein, arsR family [Candidatus Burarchaeum australiense]|nr:Bacterial regulatory protein, arsR family [Candidatus Burarchaeum australiense]